MAKSELAKKTSKQITKVKKKKWHVIVSPKFMGETPMGESFLDEDANLEGRTIKVNLMQLTGDIKNQNSDVLFQITGMTDSKIETRIAGYSFSSAAIKRFVRRHMTRVDDSLVVTTKDNMKVRIKPLALTRSKVSRSVEYALRASLREELINLIRNTTYEHLFSMVLKYQLQKELKEKLAKVYPLRTLEIRALEEEKHHSAKEAELPVKKLVKKTKAKKEEVEEGEEEAKEESSEASETEEGSAEEAEESEDFGEEEAE